VGLSDRDYGEANRCISDEVAGLAGFWFDFDLRSQAHAKQGLPSTLEEALSVIPPEFAPTVVVTTGNGLHAWWLFKEPWVFESQEERRKAAALSFRWQTLIKYNAAQKGWALDRLADLARVLRIPGTVNAKDPNNIKAVTLHSYSEHRYNPSDFEKYLDKLSIPTDKAEEGATQRFAERFDNSPLVIDSNAAISEEQLAGWMQQDMRFRNTWNRRRHDLPDQSGSGYDMALACFGVSAGFTDQQIIDLN
jgi:putative DNA primase/helicase